MTEQTDTNTDMTQAVDLLEGLMERMAISVQVTGEEIDDKLLVKIECDEDDDTQRLIGRRGQVIDALQHLVNKMMSRDREDRGKPVIVDVGDYREKHVERLEELAERMVAKARESGEPVDLNPMSAYDRRIVHMRIAEQEGVSTRSEGEGDRRHIVVLPE
jgi:spoIIIJ-associated protein